MFRTSVASVAILVAMAATAQAAQFRITVENVASQDGLTFTPLFAAFHDGGYTPFEVGQAASASVEALAELGQTGGVRADLQAGQADAVSVDLAAADNGVPPVEPGESSSAVIDLDPTANRYFTFLSMILPSNDTFIGNDNPLAYELFDDGGAFLGAREILVGGDLFWDAGTEVNDGIGAPFVPGQDATAGTVENGVVTGAASLANFAGLTVPGGRTLSATGVDFSPADYTLARITIEEVAAPVPLPAGAPLLLAGLGAFAMLRRRR